MDSIQQFIMFVTDKSAFKAMQAESLKKFDKQTKHYVTNKIAKLRPKVSLLDK